MNSVALTATNYLTVARSVSQNTEETSGRKGNNPSKRGYYLHPDTTQFPKTWLPFRVRKLTG